MGDKPTIEGVKRNLGKAREYAEMGEIYAKDARNDTVEIHREAMEAGDVERTREARNLHEDARRAADSLGAARAKLARHGPSDTGDGE